MNKLDIIVSKYKKYKAVYDDIYLSLDKDIRHDLRNDMSAIELLIQFVSMNEDNYNKEIRSLESRLDSFIFKLKKTKLK